MRLAAILAGIAVVLAAAFSPVVPARSQPEMVGRAAHVRDFAFYGLNEVNLDIPAGWMAEHVDIVEDDGFTAQHAEAFKRAGGKLALAYTDPTNVPYCSPPFRPPAGRCEGPIGNLVSGDESAWLHDARGERVRRRYEDPHFRYQEVLNPASPAARRAYARAAAAILAHAPHLDGFVADDSGSPYTGRDGVVGSNLFGGFENRGVEIRDDAHWIEAESGMLAAAGKPVLINGGDPRTWGASYGGRFIDLPHVLGQEFEGCFDNGDSGFYTERDRRFEREADGLLEVTAHRKLAVCLPTGPPEPARRLYVYAAWLLTYDPRYSVFGMHRKLRDGFAVYPEVTLVPGAPRASGPIASLRRGATYVREFAACAIAQSPLGPCAAVVNAGESGASLPPLEGRYARHLTLDAVSSYTGGRVRVADGLPAGLAGTSAAILVR